jgi:hypothetical protein
MAQHLPNPGTLPWSSESVGSPHSASLAPAARIESLEGLRQRVLERLDSLELLARQRPTFPTELEVGEVPSPTLELKQAALEETEHRLKAQALRQEKEWTVLLAQLEADRRLLAEAWERIEQERIASSGSSGQNDHSEAQSHHHPLGHRNAPRKRVQAKVSDSGTTATARSAPAEASSDRPLGQEILRQFQTLCSDVRRNAEDRREAPDSGRRSES